MNEMHRLEKQKSQSGQAVVEYILIVGLAVTIILGLMNQLYKPFGDWMQDYMGQYIECLLDVGELPTIAGSSESGECNSKFQSFSVTGGRPPVASNSGSIKTDPNKANQSPSSGPTAGGSSSDAESAALANRARSRSGSGAFPVGKPTGSDGSQSALGNSNEIKEKLPESKFMKLRSSRGSIIESNLPVSRTGLNQSFMMNRRQTSVQAEKIEQLALNEEVGSEGKSKKFMVRPPERKVSNVEEDSSWSFSEYFKYGLIILIVVALVLFLGGQLLQISKSMEK